MTENQSFDDKLTKAARSLETEVAPERDLWPAIENAIQPPAHSRWNTLFAQAAAVVLLVGASSGLTYLTMNNSGPYTTPPVDGRPLSIEQSFRYLDAQGCGELGTGKNAQSTARVGQDSGRDGHFAGPSDGWRRR